MSGWVQAPPFSSSPNVTETIWRRARLPEKQILGMYANAQEYVILSHVAYHCLRHFRGVTLLGWDAFEETKRQNFFQDQQPAPQCENANETRG